MKEIWRPVVGYEDRYEVSSAGRVRRLARIGTHPCNRWGKPHLFTVLAGDMKASINGKGYPQVSLRHEVGVESVAIHRLVADAFLPPCNGRQVNHKNYDRRDNRLDNLEWATPKENTAHGARGPNWINGERHHNSKLNCAQVSEIRRLLKTGMVQNRIADQFKVGPNVVSGIKTGKMWKHLPEERE